MSETNGNGTPWWLQAAYRLGVPAVIALGFSYFLANQVYGQVTETQSLLVDHMQQMDRDQTEIRFYLRGICLNVADTPEKRDNCLLEK